MNPDSQKTFNQAIEFCSAKDPNFSRIANRFWKTPTGAYPEFKDYVSNAGAAIMTAAIQNRGKEEGEVTFTNTVSVFLQLSEHDFPLYVIEPNAAEFILSAQGEFRFTCEDLEESLFPGIFMFPRGQFPFGKDGDFITFLSIVPGKTDEDGYFPKGGFVGVALTDQMCCFDFFMAYDDDVVVDPTDAVNISENFFDGEVTEEDFLDKLKALLVTMGVLPISLRVTGTNQMLKTTKRGREVYDPEIICTSIIVP